MHRRILFILLPLCLLSVVVLPWIGGPALGMDVLLRPFATDIEALIFWRIRLPRVLLDS